MKLSLLSEGWEDLGIEDPNISDYKWAYANVSYYSSLSIDEVLDLVKRLLNIRGYDLGRISLVPGTIEDNEDEPNYLDMKSLQVDVEIEPRFFDDLRRSGYLNLTQAFPNWKLGYQDIDQNLIEIEFEADLNVD